MSITSNKWIKYIESLVIQSQDIPMWGTIPSFPWVNFANKLTETLNTKKLKISAGTCEWKTETSILSGLGRNPLQLALILSPLPGNLSIIFPSEDFSKLSSWMIYPEARNEGFSDPYLQKGFFRYLCVEALNVLDQLKIYQGLNPKVIELPLKKEDAYCIDIAIEQDNETIWGRIVCPTPFQEGFKSHFSKDWNFSIPSDLYQDIFLDLSLSVGKTTLSQTTFSNMSEGDFIILDYCSYYPNLKKGTFQLQLEQQPLFHVKTKEEHIKILDYAHYFEENKMSDEKFDEQSIEDKEALPEGNKELPEGKEALPEGNKELPESKSTSLQEAPKQPLLSPKKIPISLTVQVARIRMNLDKLLKLKPGNVLDLGLQPEKGVDLVANGQCVGKGELIQLGDVIGVKIIKLGE